MGETKLDFAAWLRAELQARGLRQSELARLSGLSEGTISKTLKLTSFPTVDTLISIAKALELPPDYVLQQAGQLPLPPQPNQNQRRITETVAAYKLDQLTDSQLDQVIQFIDFLQSRSGGISPPVTYPTKTVKSTPSKKQNRQGELPAELIKE